VAQAEAEPGQSRERYWALVCNPAKWAIDDFLRSGEVEDEWGVDRRARNEIRNFSAGQLAVVRVGRDSRNRKQLDGNAPLKPGIYGLCEILSKAYPGPGDQDKYWFLAVYHGQ
jgi:predicted RNA-binding protein with PUA-like domain